MNREVLTLELGELADLLPTLDWNFEFNRFELTENLMLFADQGEAKLDFMTFCRRLRARLSHVKVIFGF